MIEKVCLVGSGNWGSCISKLVGNNILKLHHENPSQWCKQVNMWVYEEFIHGSKLSDIINNDHENIKYLPGIKLPENVCAVPDLLETVKDATLIIFVVPHQFISKICDQLKGNIVQDARAISLIKGIDDSDSDIQLISEKIKKMLDIEISVLMGANVANDIAKERFSEATIGFENEKVANLWKKVLEQPYFRINLVKDVQGVELLGALKNIIAIAAGFIDGLFPEGGADNTKAAIIRRGLIEMAELCKIINGHFRKELLLESCGLADLITSSYGGRNRKVAEAFVTTHKSLDDLEVEMLNGQKLQGPMTAKKVYESILQKKNLLKQFPIVTAVYNTCYQGYEPKQFLSYLENN